MKPTNEKIFFSYGTVAQMCEPAYEAMKLFLEEFYKFGPPEVLYKYDSWGDKVSVEAARLLNCKPSEITTTKNTTEGINIASEAMPLDVGDEILVIGNEYASNLLPWLKKRKDGITVTVINEPTNEQSFQTLLAAVKPATKAIAISSAQYYDGFMADLEVLSGLRQKGIFIVLDAVQTVGVRKIDLQKTPVDFLACGGQKYLCAGMGNGFLYVNSEILNQLRDTKVGIRSMERFDTESYTLKSTADRFQDSTQNAAGIVALHASLLYINNIGIENIETKNIELLRQIKNCLNEHGIPFIDYGDKQSNIVSMRVPDPKALFDFLKERAVYVRPIKDVVRMTFIHESNMEDVRQMAGLIQQWLSTSTPTNQ